MSSFHLYVGYVIYVSLSLHCTQTKVNVSILKIIQASKQKRRSNSQIRYIVVVLLWKIDSLRILFISQEAAVGSNI
jgi:hypothetical protein